MTFQPVVPLGGYAGWKVLERTLPVQQAAFANSAPVSRATDAFRDRIASVQTAADLVADRQLLAVALGAFGLDDDINNRFFIETILAQGTVDEEALANRLADKRYAEFSAAFGFGDRLVPRTAQSGFADEIIARYENQQFARAVGTQNNDMRLALNVSDGLAQILEQTGTNNGRWFAIMGNPPLRQVFQTALGLPADVISIDLDRQRDIFQERARAAFGTDDVGAIASAARQEDLRRLFLIRSEAATFGGLSAGQAALTLLQQSGRLT
jgi:hypothetical protein